MQKASVPKKAGQEASRGPFSILPYKPNEAFVILEPNSVILADPDHQNH